MKLGWLRGDFGEADEGRLQVREIAVETAAESSRSVSKAEAEAGPFGGRWILYCHPKRTADIG